MIIDGVPGLTIHEHEGRLAGTFELPPADLAAIQFNGRIMLAIVADVGAPFRVTTDLKEDINTAHWTFKAVDAAIVRSEGLRNLLVQALHMDAADVDIVPEADDDESSWELDPETIKALSATRTVTRVPDLDVDLEDLADFAGEIVKVADDVEFSIENDMTDQRRSVEVYIEDDEDEPGPIHVGETRANIEIVEDIPPERVQRFGQPVRYKDKTLARYIEDDRDFAESRR